ncbi:MAG: RNA methyltransferase [Lachnospiraceae bacterium]|nr:RNA methyltransferase [Lachnospiraceae bacterium]
MIKSISNSKIKHVIKLREKRRDRRNEGLFVSEGLRIVMETPLDKLRELYIAESFLADQEKFETIKSKLGVTILDLSGEGMATLKICPENEILIGAVSDDVMKKMSDTDTPQGILAVSEMPKYTLDELLERRPHAFILLEDIQDPGNLGTIMRTAEGADITGIIMTKQTVDLFSPKVVRATMGSIFRVPFYETADLKAVISRLQEEGTKIYAAYLGGERMYDEVNFTEDVGYLIGNEGNGLKRETAMCADELILIPMGGELESLNAAMASGILAYEIKRQRRNL